MGDILLLVVLKKRTYLTRVPSVATPQPSHRGFGPPFNSLFRPPLPTCLAANRHFWDQDTFVDRKKKRLRQLGKLNKNEVWALGGFDRFCGKLGF